VRTAGASAYSTAAPANELERYGIPLGLGAGLGTLMILALD